MNKKLMPELPEDGFRVVRIRGEDDDPVARTETYSAGELQSVFECRAAELRQVHPGLAAISVMLSSGGLAAWYVASACATALVCWSMMEQEVFGRADGWLFGSAEVLTIIAATLLFLAQSLQPRFRAHLLAGALPICFVLVFVDIAEATVMPQQQMALSTRQFFWGTVVVHTLLLGAAALKWIAVTHLRDFNQSRSHGEV